MKKARSSKKPATSQLGRRRFIQSSAMLCVGASLPGRFAFRRDKSINEKLRIGVVGVANRGGSNLHGVKSQSIAALCDIDANYLARACDRFPQATPYRDWRHLFDRSDLDAIVVSTPDHLHAPVAATALRNNLDVYCEKPLAHTVAEARLLNELSQKHGRITQMGTQIHAGGNYRRVVEAIRAKVIGEVTEVHVFVNGKAWSASGAPHSSSPVPKHIDWDLWLGPAAARPFDSAYMPGSWRRYWDFGGGTLGDMACHYLDLPFWALELKSPISVRAEGPQPNAFAAPSGLAIHYEFPKPGTKPPLKLSWWDGDLRPLEVLKARGLESWHNGVLFVGEKGWLVSGYGSHQLGPVENFKGYQAPAPTIPDSIGHYAEWIEACKNRSSTTCSFDYSGLLTEAVLLGVVAHRAAEPFRWDAKTMTVQGSAKAQALINKTYRKGWSC